MDETSGSGGQAFAASGSSVPFDDRSLPFGTRFLETIKMAFAEPGRLFSNLPESDIGPPVLFGVLTGTVTVLFSLMWQLPFGGLAALAERTPAADFVVGAAFMTLMALLSPALALVGLFISSGILHLMLMLVGGAKRGFGVTLRAVCYGSAPQLLGILPICGGLVGGIWNIVLVILGAMYGHRTDAWRAILAYFLPMLVCCCLLFYLASTLGLLGLASR